MTDLFAAYLASADGALLELLSWMSSLLTSYCGSSVFAYDASVQDLTAFLSMESSQGDLTLSSVRTHPGEALEVNLHAMHVELDSDAAASLQDALARTAGTDDGDNDDGGEFWDIGGYSISREHFEGQEGMETLLSDVFELNFQLASLPPFEYCNNYQGAVGDSDTCVTKRVGSHSVSGLTYPIRFTVTVASIANETDFTYSCQFVNTTSGSFSDFGCEVAQVVELSDSNSQTSSTTTAQVTCACYHTTAFAVRKMVKDSSGNGQSACDALGNDWRIYNSEGYRAFVVLMMLGWACMVGILFNWAIRSGVKKKLFKATVGSVANSVFFLASLLRIVYFGLLLTGWQGKTAPNVACVEFGLDGSHSTYFSTEAPLIVHDLAEPLLLIAFTAVVTYWYNLQKSLSGSLAKLKSSKWLSSTTLYIFLAVDVLVLLLYVAVNFGLLAEDHQHGLVRSHRGTIASSLLVLFGFVCLLEAFAFICFGRAVAKALGSEDKMSSVLSAMRSSSVMFIVLGLLQMAFSRPETLGNATRTFALYSITFHVVELFGVWCMIRTLSQTRSVSRDTASGSSLERGRLTSGSRGSWKRRSAKGDMRRSGSFQRFADWLGRPRSTSKITSSQVTESQFNKNNESQERLTQGAVELNVSYYDFNTEQYVSRVAQRDEKGKEQGKGKGKGEGKGKGKMEGEGNEKMEALARSGVVVSSSSLSNMSSSHELPSSAAMV